MRSKLAAGVLVALAFLIPAAPAAAQAQAPGLDPACQTVERKVYKDIRELVTIDLDTATTTQVRLLANQILAEANREQLPVLSEAIQKRLDGTADDLRAFLKADLSGAWLAALRVEAYRTLTNAGPNVQDAAKKALDDGSIDVLLAYLNTGVYEARELDCKSQPTATPTSQPTATPSATPSATTTAAPTGAPSVSPGAPGGEGGEGGGLPVTGSDTATVAGIGGALLLLGGVGFVIGRRRRARFVA
ncbi:ALF repeat-containing protein [Micromonospora humi]|uniref:LPXTG-motif cell wall anchor domain-containing protein n=1 Tax=Micromonospora humi TaxID=745366 RepID=A0A1C5HEM1_9ACTN|nr:ALF repeat-containing protein [Micromonospora humi]SCG44478.1 LPXTG-motif cell wall anchor domain-containing protein [Micromonospora humi]